MERVISGPRRGSFGTGAAKTIHPTVVSPKCRVESRAEPVGQPKVVCVGEALFDVIADDKGKKKEEVASWTSYPGGAPCNVACGLGKLDIPVAFVSCLGEDENGEDLIDMMDSRGVDTSAVRRVPEPTREVFVVRTEDGDRIFDSFGQDTKTYCDCFIRADDIPVDTLQKAQVVVMGTLGLAYPETNSAMKKVMEICKEADTLVMVDMNWRPVFWDDPEAAKAEIIPFMEQADLVKITEEESEWAYGIEGSEALSKPNLVLEKLPKARGVLVTAGGDGCSYCIRSHGKLENTGIMDVFDVEVQDTTGAGDAFTCGFLAYLLAEKADRPILELLESPEETRQAVKFAAACGALTTIAGGAIAAQPSLDEIERLVEAQT